MTFHPHSFINGGFMLYVLTMVLLIVLYVAAFLNMRHLRNTALWNAVFTILIFGFYLCVVTRAYLADGFYDWNFRNTLPTANVSPFMFTLVVVMHLLPKKIKKYFYLLISLLSVGMIISPMLGCIYNASINYKFHLHFVADFLAHVLISLWGVYLVKTGQVELSKRSCIISSLIIIGSAIGMLILNLIFDTSFFGLSLNGKHNIYNNVLTDNSYLSAALYFIGLCAVLGMGYLYSRIIAKKS